MLYLVLLLALLTLALIALQRYSLAKLRRGFSLYDAEKRERFRFPDRNEDAVRQWLESEDGEPLPLRDEPPPRPGGAAKPPGQTSIDEKTGDD